MTWLTHLLQAAAVLGPLLTVFTIALTEPWGMETPTLRQVSSQPHVAHGWNGTNTCARRSPTRGTRITRPPTTRSVTPRVTASPATLAANHMNHWNGGTREC